MPEIVPVPIVDLLLDEGNPRLKDEQQSQQAALLAIVAKAPEHFVRMAGDIVANRLDPLSPIGVVATGDQRNRYRVLEGNRRVAALKALETPSLAASALDGTQLSHLQKLSEKFTQAPVSSAPAVVFSNEEESRRWIELRHTGVNEGAGLVPWGSDETDRWRARHGKRKPAGQVIDFLKKHGHLVDDAGTKDKIFTNLTRLINTPEVRERLGIELQDGEILTWYPPHEVAKGLARVVEDLREEVIKVKDIYEAGQRKKYIKSLKPADLPKKSERLDAPRRLNDVKGPGLTVRPRRKASGRKRQRPQPTALIPREVQLNIEPPRINAIYNELAQLSVDQYPNACSVTLRVFVELSVDHYITTAKVAREDQRRNWPLAKRMKLAVAHLNKKGKINDQLKSALDRVADSGHALAASLLTFNMYVHNQYTFPKPTELRAAWEEIQPLMVALWP